MRLLQDRGGVVLFKRCGLFMLYLLTSKVGIQCLLEPFSQYSLMSLQIPVPYGCKPDQAQSSPGLFTPDQSCGPLATFLQVRSINFLSLQILYLSTCRCLGLTGMFRALYSTLFYAGMDPGPRNVVPFLVWTYLSLNHFLRTQDQFVTYLSGSGNKIRLSTQCNLCLLCNKCSVMLVLITYHPPLCPESLLIKGLIKVGFV